MWGRPAIDAMREMQTIGLNDFDIITVPGHLWPEDHDQNSRKRLRSDLEKDGIRIESLNLPGIDQTMASSIPSARDYAVQLYIDGLELASDLGVRNVVVVPGRISPLLPPPADKVLQWVSGSLERILCVCEKNDQTLFLESTPATPVPTVDHMMRLLDHFNDHPRLRIAYDVASAEFIGEDAVAAIKKMGKRLGQTHLSDSTRKTWRHDRIGDGTVKFGPILKALTDSGFEGVNVLEVISPNPLEDMRSSMAALEKAA
jgi:sugar phosphate isomerase/epimerase